VHVGGEPLGGQESGQVRDSQTARQTPAPIHPNPRDPRRRHPRQAATTWWLTRSTRTPSRELRLGFPTAGHLLEIVVLLLDHGDKPVLHAMPRDPRTTTYRRRNPARRPHARTPAVKPPPIGGTATALTPGHDRSRAPRTLGVAPGRGEPLGTARRSPRRSPRRGRCSAPTPPPSPERVLHRHPRHQPSQSGRDNTSSRTTTHSDSGIPPSVSHPRDTRRRCQRRIVPPVTSIQTRRTGGSRHAITAITARS